jgi:DNA-binding CsgD family transcriptional regulator
METVRETGGRETGVPDSIAGELTAREVEILLLLEDRLETDEIAKRLFISEHTVRSHVKSILRKLDVSSRRDAVEKLVAARG